MIAEKKAEIAEEKAKLKEGAEKGALKICVKNGKDH